MAPLPRDILSGRVEIALSVAATEPPIDRVEVFAGGKLVGSASPPAWRLVWDAPKGAAGKTLVAVGYSGERVVAKASLETARLVPGEEVFVELVQLYPAVTDRDGRYVEGLGKGDFVVLDRGKPVEIAAFEVESTALTVALVLDVSSSMQDRIAFVRDASRRFLSGLRGQDRACLYAFNETVASLSGLEARREETADAIGGLTAGGATALYDALVRVAGDLRRVKNRKAVFVYSDGEDNRSVASFDRALAALRESDAVIFTVRPGEVRQGETGAGKEQLRRLAEETGGRAFLIRSIGDLDAVYGEVLRHLRAQYVLAYEPPSGPPGVRAVEVRVRDRRLKVACRTSYVKH